MLNRHRFVLAALGCAAALTLAPASAHAVLTPYDALTLSCEGAGENTIQLGVTAGLSGAPAGITVQWMKYDDYVDNGGWLDSDDAGLCKLSLSGQPSLRDNNQTRWEMGSGAFEIISIDDGNYDETGVSAHGCGLDPLECGTQYIFRAFAHAGRGFGRSDWSANVICSTSPCPSNDCTFTQGYWKNHEEEWPVSSLVVGSCNPQRTYTQAELLAFFNTPAQGNGLVSLGHQLVAAMLNRANGCTCPLAEQAIGQANALIGCQDLLSGFLSPGSTSSLTSALDAFNQGLAAGCPGHSDTRRKSFDLSSDPAQPRSWGEMKATYR